MQRIVNWVREQFAQRHWDGRFWDRAEELPLGLPVERVFCWEVPFGPGTADWLRVECVKVDPRQGFVVLEAKTTRSGRRVFTRIDSPVVREAIDEVLAIRADRAWLAADFDLDEVEELD